MNAKSCLLCGKSLARIRVGAGGDFCSREHRNQYRLRRSIDCLTEANKVIDAGAPPGDAEAGLRRAVRGLGQRRAASPGNGRVRPGAKVRRFDYPARGPRHALNGSKGNRGRARGRRSPGPWPLASGPRQIRGWAGSPPASGASSGRGLRRPAPHDSRSARRRHGIRDSQSGIPRRPARSRRRRARAMRCAFPASAAIRPRKLEIPRASVKPEQTGLRRVSRLHPLPPSAGAGSPAARLTYFELAFTAASDTPARLEWVGKTPGHMPGQEY